MQSYTTVEAAAPVGQPMGDRSHEPAAAVFLTDSMTGMRGFVFVDTLVGGRAMGGVRITPSITPDQIRQLARAMSMKFALGRVPVGGAKGGILLPRGEEHRRDEFLDAFGRLVAPLLHGGVYLGTDMGMTFADRKRFMDVAAFEVRDTSYGACLPCDWQAFWRECVDVGGHGVSEATLALLPLIGLGEREVRVAVHGFGTMGRGAARYLARAGHLVVAVADRCGSISSAAGLPIETLIEATGPDGIIDRSALHGPVELESSSLACLCSEVDVLVVASLEDVVHADNVGQLRCRAVVEAANHPCTDEARRILAERGVAVAPDIVANAASAMTSGLVVSGDIPTLPMPELKRWMYTTTAERVRRNIVELWTLSQQTGLDMAECATKIAKERLAQHR